MAIQYTPSLGLPYPQVTDAPLIASRDLRGLALKMDSEGAQIKGESVSALTAAQAAEALATQALSRAQSIEDPIHVGPTEPTDGEELWVDTDEDAPDPGGEVTSNDITDASTVGRAILTAPLSVNARNALSIFTGTRALLDAGTDEAERTWDAKELHEYVTDQVAAGGGAASWDDLTGKPTTFPPSEHTHDGRYYTEAEVDAKIAEAIAGFSYDSGWRDVSGNLHSDAVGTLYIRRVGLAVYWLVNGMSNPSSHVFYIPPVALAASPPGVMYPVQSTESASRIYLNAAGQFSRTRTASPIPAGTWQEGMYPLPPGAPAPTSLPGVLVS